MILRFVVILFEITRTIQLIRLKTLFIESWCDDERIIEENVRRVKISSPDVRPAPLFIPRRYINRPLVRGMVVRRCRKALPDTDICTNSSVPNYGRKRSELHQGIKTTFV